MGALIEVRGLRYSYPDGTRALDGIDFSLSAGEAVALLGGNGSGKTTFLLHLCGLLRGEGSITVAGLPLTPESAKEVRRKIGFVFQDADDQLFMPTVEEDVAYGPANFGASPEEAAVAAHKALRSVGLEALAKRTPYHLSGGEKRRAALAGVLATRPEILILDEPTASLDPPSQRDLTKLLLELPQAKLISTHDAGFARAFASRAVFFEKGRIVGRGPVDELVHRFRWNTNWNG